MHALAKRLFPICRSITGNGVRETLKVLKEHVPLKIREVPSGTKVFDWTVPREWNISDAYVVDAAGNKVIDFKENNLHVIGYSMPIDTEVTLEELQGHLYSLPEQPNAIPYITSYYQERWGFCIADNARKRLKKGRYRVVVKSSLKKGSLTYGELVIPGKSKKEIFLSTYVCHPSMANNELSGPVVATQLVKWLATAPRKYTYRIVFIPETIGSLTYLSKNLEHLKKHVIAGFNISCVGDDRAYSYLPSRTGDTLADRVALRVLGRMHPAFISYSFMQRGSDERQYCAPGVDLPVASVMRSKYGEYPEYHTSLDDLTLVTPAGLQGGFDVLKACIQELENKPLYRAVFLGEPQLGKRGLYATLSKKGSAGSDSQMLLDVLAYSDGVHTSDEIAALIHAPTKAVEKAIQCLLKEKLLVADG